MAFALGYPIGTRASSKQQACRLSSLLPGAYRLLYHAEVDLSRLGPLDNTSYEVLRTSLN